MSIFHSYPADENPDPGYDPAAALVRTNRKAAYERFAMARTRWLDAKKRGDATEMSNASIAMRRAWKQTQRV